MEPSNRPTTDLIAIYRLEFYKNQKNWILSSDGKKNKLEKKKNRSVLNKTYTVEEPKTELSQLNNAFLDKDFDESDTPLTRPMASSNGFLKTGYPSSTYQKSPNNLQENNQNIKNRKNCLASVQKIYTEHPLCLPNEEIFYNDINTFNIQEECAGFNNYPGNKLKYPIDNNENWAFIQTDENIWSEDLPHSMDNQYCGDTAANMLRGSENWLLDDVPIWLPANDHLPWIHENAYSYAEITDWAEECEQSADSWADFARGAHLAPHSSEIELSLPEALLDLDVDVNSLACLTSAQLNSALRTHTRLLRSLLQEDHRRRRNRSCLSLTTSAVDRPVFSPRPATGMSNYEEPTHDYIPSRLDHTGVKSLRRERTYIKKFDDIFVAGSYRNGDLEVLGRDKGRLQSVRRYEERSVGGFRSGRP
ncbi:uncharacterized protein [Battus philenor]|uniref:uncharacterized protein n=1 Tax=Battus philenor TaxID=42288 RepID=UPI0035CEBD32